MPAFLAQECLQCGLGGASSTFTSAFLGDERLVPRRQGDYGALQSSNRIRSMNVDMCEA